MSKIDPENPGFFVNIYDKVYVDEKWFYLKGDGTTYILADGEEPLKRKFKYKDYITKVIFLCAQARPRMVEGVMWDGKVGIW